MLEEVGESGIKILLHLLVKGRTKLTGFKKDIGLGITTVYNAMVVLEKYGLVKEHQEGKARIFELTERGQRVAEYVMSAESIIKESHS